MSRNLFKSSKEKQSHPLKQVRGKQSSGDLCSSKQHDLFSEVRAAFKCPQMQRSILLWPSSCRNEPPWGSDKNTETWPCIRPQHPITSTYCRDELVKDSEENILKTLRSELWIMGVRFFFPGILCPFILQLNNLIHVSFLGESLYKDWVTESDS